MVRCVGRAAYWVLHPTLERKRVLSKQRKRAELSAPSLGQES